MLAYSVSPSCGLILMQVPGAMMVVDQLELAAIEQSVSLFLFAAFWRYFFMRRGLSRSAVSFLWCTVRLLAA